MYLWEKEYLTEEEEEDERISNLKGERNHCIKRGLRGDEKQVNAEEREVTKEEEYTN